MPGIVNQKAGTFDPEKFEDHYESALVELINQKRAGKVIRPMERPKGENVVDLMEVPRQSVGREVSAEPKRASKSQPRRRVRLHPDRRKSMPIAGKKPAKKSRKASAGQKEMLMPISGKKPAKEASGKKLAAKGQRKSA